MPSAQDLSQLLLSLYSVPTEPAKWPSVLAELAGYLGVPAAALISTDAADDRVNMLTHVGGSQEAFSLYSQYYWKKDAWRVPAERQPVMQPLFGTEACSLADLKKTEFYNDFLRKHHPYNLYVGFTTARSSRLYETISFLYGLDKKPPGPETLNRFKLVLPHLRSALVLRRKLVDLEYAKCDRENALHLLGIGIVLLDEDGTCFFVNKSAEEILSSRDGLALLGSKLTATLTHESNKLQCMIRNATTLGVVKEGSAMLVSRKDRKPLQAYVSSFLPADLNLSKRTVAVVLIVDPEDHRTTPAELLCTLYGLTPAESRLAMALAEGKELRQICDEASITYTTGRSHLRSIFSKVGVGRQVELVSLILRIGLPDR